MQKTNIPYKTLFALEQKFLPLVFLVWETDPSSVVSNFNRYCQGFNESLERLEFSAKGILKTPIAIHMDPGMRAVELRFPFMETVDCIGLARAVYLLHSGDWSVIQYCTVELERDALTGSMIYMAYEFSVCDSTRTIRKKCIGQVCSEKDLRWMITD